MIYGYVNRSKGETEDFLKGIDVDKIIFSNKTGCDFSFAEKDDLIVIYDFTSVCNSLKGLLELSQFINETEIQIMLVSNPFADTRNAFGRMVIGMWAELNKLDDECFRKPNCDSV